MADTETESIRTTLARSRAQLSHSTAALGEQLNVSQRVRRSVRSQPATWIAAATVIGLLLAARRRKPRSVKIETKRKVDAQDAGKAALFLGAGKLALDVLRPTLTAWLRRRILPVT
jgi:hypothetical protein